MTFPGALAFFSAGMAGGLLIQGDASYAAVWLAAAVVCRFAVFVGEVGPQ